MNKIHCALAMMIVVAAFGATLSGCLISGTKVFSVEMGTFTATGGTIQGRTFDLEGNKTYQEYKEKVRLVDRVGFSTLIEENNGQATQLSLYFSPYAGLSTPGQIRDTENALPLFENFNVPANGSVDISYDESLKLLLNVDAFKELILSGENITFYTLANIDDFSVTINDLIFTITFTVGI